MNAFLFVVRNNNTSTGPVAFLETNIVRVRRGPLCLSCTSKLCFFVLICIRIKTPAPCAFLATAELCYASIVMVMIAQRATGNRQQAIEKKLNKNNENFYYILI
jgi:hypothetical protein